MPLPSHSSRFYHPNNIGARSTDYYYYYYYSPPPPSLSLQRSDASTDLRLEPAWWIYLLSLLEEEEEEEEEEAEGSRGGWTVQGSTVGRSTPPHSAVCSEGTSIRLPRIIQSRQTAGH
jgi:hypothetical protein